MNSVLIVEDVSEMRFFLKECLGGILGQTGNLKAVSSVKEAKFQIFKNRPDFVLLDEVLPGESLEANLEYFSNENIPVILMSSLEKLQDITEEQRRFGVLSKFKKPVSFDLKMAEQELLAVLKSAGVLGA